MLEAGINIVTTADWVTGHHRDTNHRLPDGRKESEVLQAACLRGKSTFYGTGMNPGLAQILTIVHSADVADIEKVTCTESVDVSCHHSAETWENCGYGRPVDDPEVPRLLELGTRVFEDGVRLMADCLDIELDEVAFTYELGACTKDVDLGWFQLAAGSVGGSAFSYVGKVDGVPRVELRLEWQMTPHTEPRWDIQGCYITRIDGDPVIYSKHMILPKPGHGFLQTRVLRVDRHDGDRDAGAERDSIRGGCAAGPDHQRGPAAAGVRRTVRCPMSAAQRTCGHCEYLAKISQ